MAALYGRNILDTLHERVGDEEQLRGNSALSTSNKVNGFWGRFIGYDGRHKGNRRGIYGNSPAYDTNIFAGQIGLDIYRHTTEKGRRDHAGVYGAYGEMESRVDHNILSRSFHAGRVVFEGYTLGAYWTHFEPNGAYLDLIAQGTKHQIEIQSLRLPTTHTDGFGVALSAEGGYPIPLDDEKEWLLEPQAQLVYQIIDIDGFTDPAAEIRFRDDDSLVGRLGLRLAQTGPNEGWIRANIWHEFMGTPKTEFSSAIGFIPFRADLPETWLELGAGYSVKVDPRSTLIGSAAYETTFDGRTYSWNIKIGFRVNW